MPLPHTLSREHFRKVSSIQEGELNIVFQQLDEKINHLAKKLDSMRKHDAAENERKYKSKKCTLICQNTTDKVKCLQECMMPVVRMETIQSMKDEFPIDVQRLENNPEIKEKFLQFQHSPESMNSKDATYIADIYAMPIATATLPEKSWDRAFNIMKRSENRDELNTLIQRWVDRKNQYSAIAEDELARKIRRHDSDKIIYNAIEQFSNDADYS